MQGIVTGSGNILMTKTDAVPLWSYIPGKAKDTD